MRDEPLPRGQKRIGDAERRAVDERLQHAVGDGVLTLSEYEERASLVWRARTQGELTPITEDLPDPHSQLAAAEYAPAASRTRWGVAVMGGHDVRGPFAPGERIRVVAVMGGGSVDLRRGDLPAVVDIQAAAVMGSVEVFVPVGARVERSGFALMGGVEQTTEPGRPDAPLVRVTAHALMGGVVIGHGPTDKRVDAGTPPRVGALAGNWPASGALARPTSGAVRRGPERPRGGVIARRVAGLAVAGALAVGAGYVVSQAEVVSIFGSQVKELSPDANPQDVDVLSVFGSVQVVVPNESQVDNGGLVVFGNQECSACGEAGSEGTGNITVTGYGAFSNIEVITKSEADAANDDSND